MLPWSVFNTLGQSRAVRSSYFWVVFVPIVAKLLSGVPQDYLLPIFGLKVNLVLGVPFTWELLYYSAVLFALASLVYSLFCPEIVKNYGKYSDFLNEGKGSEQLIAYSFGAIAGKELSFPFTGIGKKKLLRFAQAYSVKHGGIDPEDPEYIKLLDNQQLDRTFHPKNMTIREDRLAGAFWYIRDAYDQHAPCARVSVLALFLGGFTLILWILVQNFWYVFSRHLS